MGRVGSEHLNWVEKHFTDERVAATAARSSGLHVPRYGVIDVSHALLTHAVNATAQRKVRPDGRGQSHGCCVLERNVGVVRMRDCGASLDAIAHVIAKSVETVRDVLYGGNRDLFRQVRDWHDFAWQRGGAELPSHRRRRE